MSDEHDSLFQNAFGFDVGGAVQTIKNEAAAVGGIVATLAFKTAGLYMAPGGSLALIGALCLGIIFEHEAFRTFRDTLKGIVDKAHADLTILNTTIAFERKKLEAMKKAAGGGASPSAGPNGGGPKPTVRPDDLPDTPVRPEDLPDARK